MIIEYPIEEDGRWWIFLKNNDGTVIGRYDFATEDEATQFLSIGHIVVNEGIYDDGK